MSMLRQQLKDAANALQGRFKLTNSYKNPNTNGAIKEDFIREEIQQRLPSGMAFGKGEIIDSFGHQTGEHDIVGYDRNFMPLFQAHGAVSTFFSESVFCSIEAKSRLDKAAIEDAQQKFTSIRKIRRIYHATPLSTYQSRVTGVGGFQGKAEFGGRAQKGDIPRIVTGIICLDSVKPDTVEKHLNALALDADLVCVLGTGLWMRQWDANSWKFQSEPDSAYYLFIILLHELTHSHLLRHLYAKIDLINQYN